MKFRLLLGPPFLLYTYNGCMAEWFKAPVLKTGIEKSIWGSNPYASASCSWIVQMVERCSVKANVTGSSPVPGAIGE